MVLMEKRFLEKELEFTVQTDLYDDQGTVWQSVTWFSVPFKQETLLVPLSASAATLDESLVARATASPVVESFACSKRNLAEFEEVSVVGAIGELSSKEDTVPPMWMLARATGMLQQQGRVPPLPLMCSCVFGEELGSVPLQQKLQLQSWVSEDAAQEEPQTQVTKFAVADADGVNAATGVLRSVGWVFPGQGEEAPEQ
jgi:hypothetical protein